MIDQAPSLPRELDENILPRRPLRHFSKLAGWTGVALLAILAALAVWPGAFAPYDPSKPIGKPLEPPGDRFALGTNDIGQDLFSELIWGTRNTLVTGLAVGCLAVAIGVAAGLVSGYTSGILQAVVMGAADLMLALPFLPLVILLAAYLEPGQANVVLVLVLVSWAGPARLIRSQTLTLLNEPYVEAAQALGCSRRRVLWAHIWPGVRSIALAQLVLVASAAILAEASLSFLGLGNPSAKSWGTMLYFARASGAFLGEAWQWWVLPAGLMITLTVLSLVLIGFAIEQRFEPAGGGR